MTESKLPSSNQPANPPRKFYYGWVVVAVCTLMIGITYGLMYSYSVFFKPLADYFSWDRATVSVVYSASLVIRGAFAVGVGWLADRYGPVKLSIFCGIMIGVGLVLSSRASDLWQFFLTYAVIEAIGLSGAFGIGSAMVSRWFTRNRGLALGIVSTGSGLGTLFIVPGNEKLISALGWSNAFLVCGITAGVIMIAAAFLLRSHHRTARLFIFIPLTSGRNSKRNHSKKCPERYPYAASFGHLPLVFLRQSNYYGPSGQLRH